MTKLIKLKNSVLVTSGEYVSGIVYTDASTYRDCDAIAMSTCAAARPRTKYDSQKMHIEASTPSSRKQDRIAQINVQLRKLGK